MTQDVLDDMTVEEKRRLFLDLIDIVWEEIYAPRIAAAQAQEAAA